MSLQESIQMLSIEQTARLLAVSDITVRRLVTSKQLPAIKIGAQWRIRLKDLRAFIEKEDGDETIEEEKEQEEHNDEEKSVDHF